MHQEETTTQHRQGAASTQAAAHRSPMFSIACIAAAVILVLLCTGAFFMMSGWNAAGAEPERSTPVQAAEPGIMSGRLKINKTPQQVSPRSDIVPRVGATAPADVALPATDGTEGAAEPERQLPPYGEPVDFAELQAQYPDAIAWIRVPGTNIDYPVMQHQEEDNFYLWHLPDGTPSEIGSVYAQPVASKDFDNPVTLLYGHTLPQFDQVFTQLHRFQSEEFFAASEKFYIFTPGHVMGYELVAQYEYDDRLITDAFDFDTLEARAEYYDYILHPVDAISSVKEGAVLDPMMDRIVQLSTCTDPDIFDKRYIVTGKLVEIWDV